mgnify:CR=1 FL=1
MSGAERLPGPARCVCSTLGFEHPLWNAAYYPEQCPEEWHLAYFMNDFQAVYLQPAEWSERPGQVEALADELEDDRFELVLEWPGLEHSSEIQQSLDLLEPLQGHIACLVLDTDVLSPDLLRQVYQGLEARFPINLQGANLGALEGAAGCVWTPSREIDLSPAGNYQVVRIPCLGLREIKPVLQQLKPLLQRGMRTGIFIEAHAQAPQRALEVRTLIELMELA